MSKYCYGDLILEAFKEFRRPMTMTEVIEYVAEMTVKSTVEVRLAVDNTLTAAWLHGFVNRDNELYTLAYGDQILSAFMEMQRPLSLTEIVDYVANATNMSPHEIRPQVTSTLALACLHDFVQRNEGRYTLASGLSELNHQRTA
ncbi:CG15579 [Drosophila busckii]|uniref:CG15579 n=1 Tax=Drosophila busckii TaxID=30019 RepID=A0A0M4ENE7_DROBS|nr:CG15579 [Drosophila busckii]